MNPLPPGVFSDVLLPGLTLEDIRNMRSVNRQYRNLNINGVAITLIGTRGDEATAEAEVAELETGDYTKTIPAFFFYYLITNRVTTKTAIIPKYDLLEYIKNNRIKAPEGFEVDELDGKYIAVDSIEFPVYITDITPIVPAEHIISMPTPIWRLVETQETDQEIIRRYKIDFDVSKYQIDKETFADIYADLVRKRILGQPYEWLFGFEDHRNGSFSLYDFTQNGGEIEGPLKIPDIKGFNEYIVDNINHLTIYDFNDFYHQVDRYR